MINKPITYVAFYANSEERQNRNSALSATNKINYICSALIRNNYKINIISPSWTCNAYGFYKGEVKKISDGITLRTFATFGAKNKIQRIIKYLFSLFQLFIYLLINTKKGEPVIVYHSVILSLPIRIAKFIKKFKLILEVEEVYQDIQPYSKYMMKSEYKIFNNADSFMFSTELLNEKLNGKNKPYTVIYGTYNINKKRTCKFNDEKIHAVYAGTFDPRKGGALAAVAAAEHLPKNYHIHIIGFGSEKETALLLDKIKEISKKSDATVTYDGLLSGEDYMEFLQKCDIGLSTQIPNAIYNETSFPSKILSYMANGLKVVTIRIKAVENSVIGDSVFYYDEQTPRAIAETILSIDANIPYDSIKLIKRLDEDFICNIKKIMWC